MKLNFLKCSEKDLYVLSKISRETFINAFAAQNNPQDFEQYITKAFSLPTIRKELEDAASHFSFIHLQNELIGYFKLNEFDAQNEFKETAGIELERIYLTRGYKGKGLGTQTLLNVIEIAKQKEKQYIWLGVWEQNLDAIRFYERHGFTKFETHPYYIGSDKQTDWLMRKEL